MTKTHVYLLVPKYSGVTGTITAHDFASGVNPNGPIQFHLVDYDENNPKDRMERDEGFDGMSDKRSIRKLFGATTAGVYGSGVSE